MFPSDMLDMLKDVIAIARQYRHPGQENAGYHLLQAARHLFVDSDMEYVKHLIRIAVNELIAIDPDGSPFPKNLEVMNIEVVTNRDSGVSRLWINGIPVVIEESDGLHLCETAGRLSRSIEGKRFKATYEIIERGKTVFKDDIA